MVQYPELAQMSMQASAAQIVSLRPSPALCVLVLSIGLLSQIVEHSISQGTGVGILGWNTYHTTRSGFGPEHAILESAEMAPGPSQAAAG